MGILSKLFGEKKTSTHQPLIPFPSWEPDIEVPLDQIVERMLHYSNGQKDFVIFESGTCVILLDGCSDEEAEASATAALKKTFSAHPDMNPLAMTDGNILVQYANDVCNVVLNELTKKNWEVIDDNHGKALVHDEVLITPLGQNKFDDFGKKALFGRAYFFKDAKNPMISRIVRKPNRN